MRRLTSTAVPESAKRGSAMRRTVWPSVPAHTLAYVAGSHAAGEAVQRGRRERGRAALWRT